MTNIKKVETKMARIVQCVPNFSEGRDIQKIEAIVEVLKNKEGFKLVNYEADKDYNRTVVTLLGDPKYIVDAVVEFTGKVLELIDMNFQSGEHPRMGAVDVIPFIPIEDITMEIAKKYGMIQPGESKTQAVRAVFFVDPKGIVRALIYYPLSLGRNFDELYRALIAMQTSGSMFIRIGRTCIG